MRKESVFNLNKLERDVPTWSGMMLKLLSWLLNSVLGYPIHIFLAKFNLVPIENAEIDEFPTFYPFCPVPIEDGSKADSLDDIKWQANFLKENECNSNSFRTIMDYHKLYKSQSLTPEQVISLVFDKISKSDDHDLPLRCFTQLDAETCKQDAHESTLRYQKGSPISVLDGIPIGVKDEFNVKGFSICHGRSGKGDFNLKDSDFIRVLRDCGAIIIGITNMHEMGMGVTGINPHHGATRNPYNDHHVTGGSTSGGATAVAAGIVPIAIGSDGGGSVRIPASFCGVHGIKPTFGRISTIGTGFSLSTVTAGGVIANNVADMALVYSLVASRVPDPRFFLPNSPITKVRCFATKDVSELTFGTYPEYVSYCHDDILDIFNSQILPKLPGPVAEVELEDLYLNKIAHMNIILAETSQNLRIIREHGSELACQTKIFLSVCERLKLKHYTNSSCQKTRAMKMFKRLFEDIDIFITPTTACLPKEINPASLRYGELDEKNALYTMWFVYLANLCGLPAVTINAGYSKTGLPVGVMITGRWWEEDVILRVAHHLETSLRQPQRHYVPF